MVRHIPWLLVFTAVFAACGQAPSASSTTQTAGSAIVRIGAIEVSAAWARPAIARVAVVQPTATSMMSGAVSTPNATPVVTQLPLVRGAVSGAYLIIRNTGNESDQLLNVRGNVAQSIELHAVIDDNGVMKMRPLPVVDIPARSAVTLQPGGIHIMMIGLTRDLVVGQRFPLTLTFARAGVVEVTVQVRELE